MVPHVKRRVNFIHSSYIVNTCCTIKNNEG